MVVETKNAMSDEGSKHLAQDNTRKAPQADRQGDPQVASRNREAEEKSNRKGDSPVASRNRETAQKSNCQGDPQVDSRRHVAEQGTNHQGDEDPNRICPTGLRMMTLKCPVMDGREFYGKPMTLNSHVLTIHKRIDKIEDKVWVIMEKMEKMEKLVNKVEKLGGHNKERLEKLEKHVRKLEKLGGLEKRVDDVDSILNNLLFLHRRSVHVNSDREHEFWQFQREIKEKVEKDSIRITELHAQIARLQETVATIKSAGGKP